MIKRHIKKFNNEQEVQQAYLDGTLVPPYVYLIVDSSSSQDGTLHYIGSAAEFNQTITDVDTQKLETVVEVPETRISITRDASNNLTDVAFAINILSYSKDAPYLQYSYYFTDEAPSVITPLHTQSISPNTIYFRHSGTPSQQSNIFRVYTRPANGHYEGQTFIEEWVGEWTESLVYEIPPVEEFNITAVDSSFLDASNNCSINLSYTSVGNWSYVTSGAYIVSPEHPAGDSSSMLDVLGYGYSDNLGEGTLTFILQTGLSAGDDASICVCAAPMSDSSTLVTDFITYSTISVTAPEEPEPVPEPEILFDNYTDDENGEITLDAWMSDEVEDVYGSGCYFKISFVSFEDEQQIQADATDPNTGEVNWYEEPDGFYPVLNRQIVRDASGNYTGDSESPSSVTVTYDPEYPGNVYAVLYDANDDEQGIFAAVPSPEPEVNPAVESDNYADDENGEITFDAWINEDAFSEYGDESHFEISALPESEDASIYAANTHDGETDWDAYYDDINAWIENHATGNYTGTVDYPSSITVNYTVGDPVSVYAVLYDWNNDIQGIFSIETGESEE